MKDQYYELYVCLILKSYVRVEYFNEKKNAKAKSSSTNLFIF